MYFLVICGHIALDVHITLKHKNNHSNEFSVFKLVKNEVLNKIQGLSCKKLKIQDGHIGFDL